MPRARSGTAGNMEIHSMSKKPIRTRTWNKAFGLLATLAVISESAIAVPIVFTDEAAWVTGTELVIDGGVIAH